MSSSGPAEVVGGELVEPGAGLVAPARRGQQEGEADAPHLLEIASEERLEDNAGPLGY